MNYIKSLEQDKLALSAATHAALTGLADLMAYLHSDKFSTDTTVQTQDIMNRVQEIQNAIYDASASA